MRRVAGVSVLVIAGFVVGQWLIGHTRLCRNTSQALAGPEVQKAAPVPVRSLTVPAQWRGKIIRTRVRHSPYKLLALTFDDGPNPELTPQVLRLLAQYKAHATFFVVGGTAKQYPQLLKQIAAGGHAIGLHSYTHPSKTSPTQAVTEIAKTAAVVRQVTGHSPTLFRPPYGITNGNLCQQAVREKYTVVLWTISSADSNPIPAETIAHNIIHTPNPGDIVLMHDGAGHTATVKALPQVLKELSAAGFKFVTIPELLQAWDEWQAQQGRKTHD